MAESKLKQDLAEKEELLKKENEYIQLFKKNPKNKNVYHQVRPIVFLFLF